MDLDKTTFDDLTVFHVEEELSIFHRLNFTETVNGKDWLRNFFNEPLSDIKKINEVQQLLKCILEKKGQWPNHISNGTLMVIERFYESQLDPIPDTPNFLNAINYKIFHGPDYALTRYSIRHFVDLIRGFQQLNTLFNNSDTPLLLQAYLERARYLTKDEILVQLLNNSAKDGYTPRQVVLFGNYLRYRFKNNALELIDIYGRFDAWHSMTKAIRIFNLCFPNFVEDVQPLLRADALFHLLLPTPVAYHVNLNTTNNFLFLTGANMAGKSTFIKAVGAAAYLAHLGMGVPATGMQLTVFDGILSNITITDNIVKGESYFFNEVQRIKNTITKIKNGRKWLVLIDELFKGTNVQDAMKCSSTVIKGLIKIPNSLFILSTHLYEIGEELQSYPNIVFRYFETSVSNEQLEFSYQLREGISNDRLGYLILKREKVVELLEKL
jgi:DNA mismatch repair ATPase MutS